MSNDDNLKHNEKEILLKVHGVDCADCSVEVEKVISRLKGVRSADFSFATSEVRVVSDPTALDAAGLEREVRKLGYQVEKPGGEGRIAFKIEGMDCAEEEELIRRKLKGVSGINDLNVNLVTQELSLVYDPALISVSDIVKAIAETGMKAYLEKREVHARPWWREPKIIFLSISGVLTATAFLLKFLGVPVLGVRALFFLAILFGGYYPARIGLAALRTFTLNVNTLLVAATLGAVALNLWDEAAILVFVFSLGGVLETYAVDKSRGSIRALMELAPKEALVVRNGQEIILPVEEVRISETVHIRPGEKIPLDGTVISGTSAVDQGPITGESIPVMKRKGDRVFAGAINQRGSLEIRVTKLAKDTTLAKIIHSVEEAQSRKSSYQRFGDKFGRYYTPSMFSLAFLVAIVPPLLFGGAWSSWLYRGLVVLVVSCSCGLALSVPVAVVAAIGNAARHGILFKGGAYLEIANDLKAMVFDKTGTLTIGRPSVTDILALNRYTREQVLGLAASIESRSEHPLADAIVRKAKEDGVPFVKPKDFQSFPGLGVRASLDGKAYIIGNERLFRDLSIPLAQAEETLLSLERDGKTPVLLGDLRKLIGVIAVSDQLRPEAGDAIRELKELGIKKVAMLTGDSEGTAQAIARQAGIDEYQAMLLPEDKLETVNELKKKYGRIAMVGDGINDAPAMAVANIGVAMGAAGTDIAIETGDIALMSDDLLKLPYVLRLSARTVNNIRINIAAVLLILAILVPLALLGRIDLISGLLINETSALIIILNGLRLLR
ncbi:MAG: heavy metal translocating P-type ATPase [Actinomycetota bacterium]